MVSVDQWVLNFLDRVTRIGILNSKNILTHLINKLKSSTTDISSSYTY